MLKKILSLLCIGLSLAVSPSAANAGDTEQPVAGQSALPVEFEQDPELAWTDNTAASYTRCLFDGEEEVTCVAAASEDDSDPSEPADVTLSSERVRCWVTLEYCTPVPYCTCTDGCSDAECQSNCDSLYKKTC